MNQRAQREEIQRAIRADIQTMGHILLRSNRAATVRERLPYTVYVPAATLPPLPVQLVWKNLPRG